VRDPGKQSGITFGKLSGQDQVSGRPVMQNLARVDCQSPRHSSPDADDRRVTQTVAFTFNSSHQSRKERTVIDNLAMFAADHEANLTDPGRWPITGLLGNLPDFTGGFWIDCFFRFKALETVAGEKPVNSLICLMFGFIVPSPSKMILKYIAKISSII